MERNSSLNKLLLTSYFDYDLIYEIFNEIIKSKNLGEYVKKVSINENTYHNVAGKYDSINKVIYINNQYCDLKKLDKALLLRVYSQVLVSFFHEIRHAYQFMRKDELNNRIEQSNKQIYKLTESDLRAIEISKIAACEYYNHNEKDFNGITHDLYMIERDANLNGELEENIQFDSLYKSEKETDYLMKSILKKYMNLGYSLDEEKRIFISKKQIISPYEKIVNSEYRKELNDFDLAYRLDIDIEDKMILGLPITYKEYELYQKYEQEIINNKIKLLKN